jgi:cell wall-associated NlpC family hydrolase
MTRNYILLFLVLLFGFQPLLGQRYVKRLERWDKKGKQEKIARKSPKFAKKYPNDSRIFFYAANAELKISEKATNKKRGYKHVLNSVKYYNRYQTKVPEHQISLDLKNGLHAQVKNYRHFFEESKNKQSVNALDLVLASTFKDTTESYRAFLAARKGTSKTEKKEKETTKGKDKYHAQIIVEATKHAGKPYKYAAKGPDNFDCSGFTRYVYLTVTGYELPHNAAMQSQLGKEIKPSEAKPGDLIFFGDPRTKRVNHAGIVFKIGDGEIKGVIHSVNSGVTIDTDEKTSWPHHWKARVVKVVNVMDLIDK